MAQRQHGRPPTDGNSTASPADDAGRGPTWTGRRVFLSCHALIFVMAFTTYYLQYAGTLGTNGLLPIDVHWSSVKSRVWPATTTPLVIDVAAPARWLAGCVHEITGFSINPDSNWLAPVPLLSNLTRWDLDWLPAHATKLVRAYVQLPTLYWFLGDLGLGLDVDVAYEGMALAGIVVGLVAAAGVHHISLYAVLYLLYLSLYVTGQQWLRFQWDIALLEAAVAALLYCPMWSLDSRPSLPPVNFLHRVLFAKFMMMTGHVKVSARCPTWEGLTALEYHYASTCIPPGKPGPPTDCIRSFTGVP